MVDIIKEIKCIGKRTVMVVDYLYSISTSYRESRFIPHETKV